MLLTLIQELCHFAHLQCLLCPTFTCPSRIGQTVQGILKGFFRIPWTGAQTNSKSTKRAKPQWPPCMFITSLLTLPFKDHWITGTAFGPILDKRRRKLRFFYVACSSSPYIRRYISNILLLPDSLSSLAKPCHSQTSKNCLVCVIHTLPIRHPNQASLSFTIILSSRAPESIRPKLLDRQLHPISDIVFHID